MIILAIDTTHEFGSIALRKHGTLIGETHLHSPDGFAHVIFGELENLLRRANLAIRDIDCFAAASGPGSFTGVRVGLTAIKGLAEATNKLVAPVSNLRALASFGTEPYRAIIVDARRGEVYVAIYNENLDIVSPEVVTRLPEWLEKLNLRCEFITVAGAPFRAALGGSRFASMVWTEAPRSLAPAVAQCAEIDLVAGRVVSALEADANYVRSSDAELFWRDK
jgi:tRNA threonylcarbamoyladenosine biosynthesis protein TsaB